MALTPLQIDEERRRLLEAQQQAANAAAGIPAGIAVNGNAYSQGTYRPPAPPSLANVPAAPPPRTDLSSANSLASVPPPPEAQTAANGALRAQRLEKAAARGGLVGQAARTELERMGVTRQGSSYTQTSMPDGQRAFQARAQNTPVTSLAGVGGPVVPERNVLPSSYGVNNLRDAGQDFGRRVGNVVDKAGRMVAPIGEAYQNTITGVVDFVSGIGSEEPPAQPNTPAPTLQNQTKPATPTDPAQTQSQPATGGGGSQPQVDATAPTLANPTTTVTQVEDAAVLPTVPEAAAPQTELERLGIQRIGNEYTAVPGGMLAAAGTGPGVSEIGGGDRTAAIQSLADTMKRDRLQTSERRQAERLRDDASAAGRYARFYGDQAVSSGIDGPRINANLANQAAGWSAEQQRLQQQIAAQEQQGPLTSNQLQADAELEQARGQTAAQQTQAAAQQTAAAADFVKATNTAAAPAQTEFTKERAKKSAQNFETLRETIPGATKTLGLMTQLQDQLRSGSVNTGPVSNVLAELDRFTGGFTGKYIEKDKFQNIADLIDLASTKQLLTGVITDRDMAKIERAGANFKKDESVNAYLLDIYTKAMQNGIDRFNAMDAYQQQNGTLEGFNETPYQVTLDEEILTGEKAYTPQVAAQQAAGEAQKKDANARGAELMSSGMTQEQVLAQLRKEGYG